MTTATNGILRAHDATVTAATRFTGHVVTYTLAAPLTLVPRGAGADSRDPTHDLEIRAPHGAAVPAGLAWARTIRRGEHQGALMVSLRLDVPDVMVMPVSLAAWPRGDGEWHLVTERARASRRAGGPGAPDVTDTDAPDTDGDRKTHQGEISP